MKFRSTAILVILTFIAGNICPESVDEELNSKIVVSAIVGDDGWQGVLSNPTSIFYDSSASEVYVADGGNHRVVIYDGDLVPKYTFDHFVRDRNSGEIVRGEPRRVVVNSYGDIILADNLADYVDVLDFRGRGVERIYPSELLGDSTLRVQVQGLAVDEADNLYLSLMGDAVTMLMLDNKFVLKRQFGQKGGGPGDLNTPLGLCARDGLVYVSDLYGKPAVKVFDTLGVYQFGFGTHDIDESGLSFPSGITVLPNIGGGTSIWVADGLRQVIKVFDGEGGFLALVGGYGVRPGEFRYPADVAAGGDSTFFVLERIGNRIQRMDIQ